MATIRLDDVHTKYQYQPRETVQSGDEMRDSQAGDVRPLPAGYRGTQDLPPGLDTGDRMTAASGWNGGGSGNADRMTTVSAWTEGDRMTAADRMTTASSAGGPGGGGGRLTTADRMTAGSAWDGRATTGTFWDDEGSEAAGRMTTDSSVWDERSTMAGRSTMGGDRMTQGDRMTMASEFGAEPSGGHRMTQAAPYREVEGGRMTRGTVMDAGGRWGGQGSEVEAADRMTEGDRLTTASAMRDTRAGDRATSYGEDADAGPGMKVPSVGQSWQEQQRAWAGGRSSIPTPDRASQSSLPEYGAPTRVVAQSTPNGAAGGDPAGAATGGKGILKNGGLRAQLGIHEIEEEDAGGVESMRLGYAGGRGGGYVAGDAQQRGTGESTGSSSGYVGGRRQPGVRPALPAPLPEEGSVRGSTNDAAGPRPNAGNGTAGRGTANSMENGSAARSDDKQEEAMRIQWLSFPELSSQWCEQYEKLDDLLERLGADVTQGLDEQTITKKKKEHGRNKVHVSADGFSEFPHFKEVPAVAATLREGRQKEILAEELVPGDIVTVQAGQRVPADARILECSTDLRVEMETIGFWKSDGEGPGHARDATEVDETVGVWECKNIVFMGCRVMSGNAKAVVIKTGANTALGVVAREMGWVDEAAAPATMSSKMDKWESAFEGKTEAIARSMGLASDAGRCNCVIL